jgi:WhiB family transcriptional regulator, redox-sensing transcriptional regulator
MSHDYDEPPTEGLCKGQDVNKWFPLLGAEFTREEIKQAQRDAQEAKSICFKCPMVEPCLEYALRHEPLGIWGGKSEAERAFIRAERNIILSREGRIYLPGIGRRNANGFAYRGGKWKRDSQIMSELNNQ